MRAAKVQASLRIRAVSPEPSLLAHTSSESRGTVRQKARSLAPLNGWACSVKICHDGMLEDTNSLDGAQFFYKKLTDMLSESFNTYFSQLMRLSYLSHRRPAKAQASLRVCAEPSLFAHMKYGSRQRNRPKFRHLAPLNGCACAVEE